MINKKTIKQFLKPDLRKILTFLFLAGLVLFFSSWFLNVLGFRILGIGLNLKIGLPFVFYSYRTSSPALPNIEHWISEVFNPMYLFLDIIIWYVFSCLIIFIRDKFKTRR